MGMDLQLQNKVVAITGGSKGIGFQTALQFVEEGATVAICARGEKQLQVAKDSIFQQTGKEDAYKAKGRADFKTRRCRSRSSN